jgi:hypothetical protein
MDTELRQLADDLTELGDTAMVALVRQSIDRFSEWKFAAGERVVERALEERRKQGARTARVALLQHVRSGDHVNICSLAEPAYSMSAALPFNGICM